MDWNLSKEFGLAIFHISHWSMGELVGWHDWDAGGERGQLQFSKYGRVWPRSSSCFSQCTLDLGSSTSKVGLVARKSLASFSSLTRSFTRWVNSPTCRYKTLVIQQLCLFIGILLWDGDLERWAWGTGNQVCADSTEVGSLKSSIRLCWPVIHDGEQVLVEREPFCTSLT